MHISVGHAFSNLTAGDIVSIGKTLRLDCADSADKTSLNLLASQATDAAPPTTPIVIPPLYPRHKEPVVVPPLFPRMQMQQV